MRCGENVRQSELVSDLPMRDQEQHDMDGLLYAQLPKYCPCALWAHVGAA